MPSFYNPYRRRRRFRPRVPPSVVQVHRIIAKRRGKCRGCMLRFEVGATIVKLSIRKRYRQACATCGRPPIGSRRYHEACAPADPVAAMHVQAIVAQVAAGFVPGVAPPVVHVAAPKPKTGQELALEAMVKLEDALVTKLKESGTITDEQEKAFARYQKLKESVVLGRPTENENRLALVNAVISAVKLAF